MDREFELLIKRFNCHALNSNLRNKSLNRHNQKSVRCHVEIQSCDVSFAFITFNHFSYFFLHTAHKIWTIFQQVFSRLMNFLFSLLAQFPNKHATFNVQVGQLFFMSCDSKEENKKNHWCRGRFFGRRLMVTISTTANKNFLLILRIFFVFFKFFVWISNRIDFIESFKSSLLICC